MAFRGAVDSRGCPVLCDHSRGPHQNDVRAGVGIDVPYPGTPEYLDPEELIRQLGRSEQVGEPSYKWTGYPVDCWALGVTALELLPGQCLFQPDYSERPVDIRPGTPEDTKWRDECVAYLHAQWVRSIPEK
jgi:serine/threonine protein kinase